MNQVPHTNLQSIRHSLLSSSSFKINISLKRDTLRSPWIICLQVRQTTGNASVRKLLLPSDLNILLPWICRNSKTCCRNELPWLQDSCPFQISGGTRRHFPSFLLVSHYLLYTVPTLRANPPHQRTNRTDWRSYNWLQSSDCGAGILSKLVWIITDRGSLLWPHNLLK